jgi:hypothetical protein
MQEFLVGHSLPIAVQVMRVLLVAPRVAWHVLSRARKRGAVG